MSASDGAHFPQYVATALAAQQTLIKILAALYETREIPVNA